MSTTLIHVDLRKPDQAGEAPVAGVLEVRAYRRRHVDAPQDGAEDYLLMPAPLTVPLVSGKADLSLAATRAGEAWLIVERCPGGATRLVAVPEVAEGEVVDYGDLVDLDPDTLTPTPLQPAWSDLEARVEVLEDQAEASQGADLGPLQESVEALEARVSTLETQVTSNLSRLSALEAQATSFQGQLDNIAAMQALPESQRGSWRFTPDTMAPTEGRFSAEGVSLYLHRLDASQVDFSAAIQMATGLRIQVESDAALWRRYEVSAATQIGDVWRLTGTLVEGAGPLPSGKKTQCAVLLTYPVATE